METRSSKRRKLLLETEQEANRSKPWSDFNGCDRISDLPNELLHQILSLLPIKTTAQTSILSKRWRSVWRSIPDLDFTSLLLPDNKGRKVTTMMDLIQMEVAAERIMLALDHEMDPIGSVLAHREKSCLLRSLRFCARSSFTRLNDLIRGAVRKNVQELDMEVVTDGHFNIPRCILTSDALRVFKLKSYYPGFRLPPKSALSNGFRSLQVLALSNIVFDKHFSLTDLFIDTSFPLLKKLSLEYCSDLEHVRFSCLALEELVLRKCYELRSLEISCAKLEILQLIRNGRDTNFDRVFLNGPKLKKIKWKYNAIASTVSFENLDALQHASMAIFGTDASIRITSVSKLLAGVSNVTCLALHCDCLETLSSSGTSIEPFGNLKYLELYTGFGMVSLEGLSYILSKAPFVQNLSLMIHSIQYGVKAQIKELWNTLEQAEEEHYWDDKAQFLKSFLQNLKVVKLCGFGTTKGDGSFVTFLIKHAQNLERMVLVMEYYVERDMQLREKICMHLRELCNHHVSSASPPQIVLE